MNLNRFLPLALAAAWPLSSAIAQDYYYEEEDANTYSEQSTFNPSNETLTNNQAAVDKAMSKLSQPSMTTAGVEMAEDGTTTAPAATESSSWFSNPAAFLDNLFTNSNDSRPFGTDSFQYRMMAGFDFVSYEDTVVGLIYTFSSLWGDLDDPGVDVDIYKDSNYFTLYFAKSFGDWFVGGVNMTLGYGDYSIDNTFADTSNKFFTLSPSPYIGVAHSYDKWGFSSVLSYVYDDTHWNPDAIGAPSFDQSSGLLTWMTRATWYACEKFDLSGSFKWTQMLHENITNNTPSFGSEDRSWGTIGARGTYYLTSALQFQAGIEYDIFNKNYGETVTGTVGATYSF